MPIYCNCFCMTPVINEHQTLEWHQTDRTGTISLPHIVTQSACVIMQRTCDMAVK